ncbi:hypothetical protein LWI28_001324 [Acer negundo]|uniref:Ubiquitin-like protease family profile domain-containing protein n=1 Tax=Acer negundo TaxID=4023 RepID=A0AAD5NFZ5_ACENE|nr:hypothetical protein LWI28_001324 [Acer negundo]
MVDSGFEEAAPHSSREWRRVCQPLPLKRRSRKTAVLKTPYTDIEVKKPKKLLKFKPFPKLPQSELNKFMAWVEEDDIVDVSKNVVQLPLCQATRAWFKTLSTSDNWLNDQHKEDMSDWLVERCANVPQQEKSDCGVFVIKYAEHLIHGESIDLV